MEDVVWLEPAPLETEEDELWADELELELELEDFVNLTLTVLPELLTVKLQKSPLTLTFWVLSQPDSHESKDD